jgi:hypothetical protein
MAHELIDDVRIAISEFRVHLSQLKYSRNFPSLSTNSIKKPNVQTIEWVKKTMDELEDQVFFLCRHQHILATHPLTFFQQAVNDHPVSYSTMFAVNDFCC